MARKRLLWQLYPTYLLIIILSLMAVTWYASTALRNFFLDERALDLEARARLVMKQLEPGEGAGDEWDMQKLCDELGDNASTRITVILPDGKVVGDSQEDPRRMENHKFRPEIAEALEGRKGRSMRPSATLRKEMMYVALPIYRGDEIIGVIRTSIPVTDIDSALEGVYLKIGLGGLGTALLVAVISLWVSRRITRPLEELRRGAGRFAQGDLAHELDIPDSLEIGHLAEAMNQMAARLDERIRTVIHQRNEQEAVLSSMVEGVLAVDRDERLINMNQAAAKMMEVDPSAVRGKTIHEIIRNTTLQAFVTKTLESLAPVEGDIVLGENRDKFIQAQGTVLRGVDAAAIGVVIVLHDVSRLRQLENVRREFVANVSHELKTPITSIKGFVETLLDGAIAKQDAKRFLEIVGRHTDRLNAIIDDLLSLSRIEQESERQEIPLERREIHPVLRAAIRMCEPRASDKGILLELDCGRELCARMNAPLLEQAVVNLLDNAIKYSEQESRIQVKVDRNEENVAIHVRDEGCGIGEEHLPRLFERFYRVDKARSREQGGTGLGLAIVKHIAQAHRGRVKVESRLGEGSVFTVVLPIC